MKNHAELRKSNRIIADITGEFKIVREFIYENLKLYELTPTLTSEKDYAEGFSAKWINKDVELRFILEEE